MDNIFYSERQIFYKINENIDLEITKIKSLNYNIFKKYENSDRFFTMVFTYPTYFIKDDTKNKCVSYISKYGDFVFTNAENINDYWLIRDYNLAKYYVDVIAYDVLNVKILWVGICVKIDFDKNIPYLTLTNTVIEFLNSTLLHTDRNDLTIENVKLLNKEFSNFIMESNSHE